MHQQEARTFFIFINLSIRLILSAARSKCSSQTAPWYQEENASTLHWPLALATAYQWSTEVILRFFCLFLKQRMDYCQVTSLNCSFPIPPPEPSRVLTIPCSHLKSKGEQAFSLIGPRLWTSLPVTIRPSPSTDIFKTGLKIHLVSSAY